VEVDEKGTSKTVMVSLFPQLELADDEDIYTEMIFIVDRSGSMSGSRMNQVKDTLQIFLRSLGEGTMFNIIGFGTSTQHLFREGSVEYNDKYDSLPPTHAHARSHSTAAEWLFVTNTKTTTNQPTTTNEQESGDGDEAREGDEREPGRHQHPAAVAGGVAGTDQGGLPAAAVHLDGRRGGQHAGVRGLCAQARRDDARVHLWRGQRGLAGPRQGPRQGWRTFFSPPPINLLLSHPLGRCSSDNQSTF
jgi:hypothetical protein